MVAALPNERPAAAQNAADAAHRLFVEYSAPLRRYCRGQLPSLEEAEDAVQSTFLRAYNALAQGVVPQHEAAWLYKIAHNVCLSRRLAATRRARVETPRDLELIQDEVGSAHRGNEELMGLDDALAKMPENLRTPFLMREWQGLSYHEIAAELGISHSAVETLIFRARRHLAQALEGKVRGRISRARQALDAGGLLAGLKALFGGTAAALQAAAAVAALAVGTAAGARTLASETHAPLDSPEQALFAELAAPPVLGSLAPTSGATPSSSAPAAAHSARRSVVLRASAAGGRIALPDAEAATAIPSFAPAPDVTTVAPAAAGAPAPAAPAPVAAAPQAGATLAATTAGATTVASAPAASVPLAPLPAPQLPALTTPAVTTPAVTTPAVGVPAVTTPAVTTPAVTTPAASTPAVTTPAVTTPAVSAPAVTAPAPTVPAAVASSVTVPVPGVSAPSVTIPAAPPPAATVPALPKP
jgi:RNA polymerase sigma factor (sigma-70 family)